MSKEEKILEKLELIQSQLKEQGQTMKFVQTQLKEHGQTLEFVQTQLKEHGQTLEFVQTQLKEHGQTLEFVQTQLKEHGQILSALIHASEVHKADNDKLAHQVAHLSGELKEGFKEVTEIQKSLLEMYGSHEAEIRALKRRPV